VARRAAGGGGRRRDRGCPAGGLTVRRTVRRAVQAIAVAILVVVLAAVATALRPSIAFAAARRVAYLRAGAEWGTVEVDGERLGWAAVGKGPPVLVVHGMRAEASVMMPLARALADRGWRAVALDLPGHGRSAPPAARQAEIDRIGEVVLQAARRLGIRSRPALLGHSMGGWIVAWQALANPGNCGPVILVSAPGVWAELPPLPRLRPETPEEVRLALPYFFADPPPLPWPLLWLAAHRPDGIGLSLLRSGLSGRFFLEGLLRGLTVPALVVAGSEDRIVPASAARRMSAEIPGATSVVIPHTGHMVVWENPDAVAAAADAFLRAAGYGEVQAPGHLR